MHGISPSRLFDSRASEERPRVAAAGRTLHPLKALSQFSEERTDGFWQTQSQFSKDTGEEDATSRKLRGVDPKPNTLNNEPSLNPKP